MLTPLAQFPTITFKIATDSGSKPAFHFWRKMRAGNRTRDAATRHIAYMGNRNRLSVNMRWPLWKVSESPLVTVTGDAAETDHGDRSRLRGSQRGSGGGELFWLTAYLQLSNCVLKYFNLSNIYKYVIGNLTATSHTHIPLASACAFPNLPAGRFTVSGGL